MNVIWNGIKMFENELNEFEDELKKENISVEFEHDKKTSDMFLHLNCDCKSANHQMRFHYDIRENEVWCDVFLQDKPFLQRLVDGVKYIFGFKTRYGHFDTFNFSKTDLERTSKFLLLADSLEKVKQKEKEEDDLFSDIRKEENEQAQKEFVDPYETPPWDQEWYQPHPVWDPSLQDLWKNSTWTSSNTISVPTEETQDKKKKAKKRLPVKKVSFKKRKYKAKKS